VQFLVQPVVHVHGWISVLSAYLRYI
jgi:hypothetical protein